MPLPQLSPGVFWAKTSTVRTADGADIRYRVLADPDQPPGPTVVLLAGFLCPDTWWHDLTPVLLDAGYRVVMLHYRGIATSSMPTRDEGPALSVERYAQDVLDVLHSAGIGEVTLVGHSMGGQVMVEVARRIPERVVSMIALTASYRAPTRDLYGQGWLISPLADQLVRTLRLLRQPMGTTLYRTVWRAVPFLPVGRAATAFGSLTPDDIVASYEDHAVTLTGAYFVDALEAMHRHDPGDVLRGLAMPTLVLAGDRDPFTPVALAKRMVEELPKGELVVVERGTHGTVLEHPRVVNDAVLDHLARTTS